MKNPFDYDHKFEWTNLDRCGDVVLGLFLGILLVGAVHLVLGVLL